MGDASSNQDPAKAVEEAFASGGAWLVELCAGAPLATSDGPRVGLRIDARLNQSDITSQTGYVLDQESLVQLLIGLIASGQAVYGQHAMQQAMAQRLSGG